MARGSRSFSRSRFLGRPAGREGTGLTLRAGGGGHGCGYCLPEGCVPGGVGAAALSLLSTQLLSPSSS